MWSSRRCCSTETPDSSGCEPCETCGSWFGSPSRMSERALVPAASTSASESWPASSTNSTSIGRSLSWMSSSGSVNAQPVPATRSIAGSTDVGLVVRRDDAATRELRARLALVLAALDAAEGEALRVGLVLDRAQQVVDRLVAERGDADALALRASARSPSARPARSCPSPAAPGRTGSSPRAREPPSTGSAVEPRVGRAALEQRHERGIRGLVAVGVRPREAEQRLADHPVAESAARASGPRGSGSSSRLDAAQHGDDAVVVVDPDAEASRACGDRTPSR